MIVAIIWQGDEKLLAATMEELITKSQCYLFYVLCNSQNSAGYRWASASGAPIIWEKEKNPEKLLNKITQTADFLVCYNNGNQFVKRLIMKFKMMGKHGRIINK